MANKIDARTVEMMVDLNGNVIQTRDPAYKTRWNLWNAMLTFWSGFPIKTTANVNTKLPLDGKHFDWELEQYRKKGTPVRPYYTPSISVCTNNKKNKKHRNTIAIPPTELVKLDCGYWGAFHKDKEVSANPQRDFGMIEGFHVWLCRFNPYGKVNNSPDLLPDTSLAKKLFDIIENNDFGFGVEIVSHTTVPHSTSTDSLPKLNARLIIAFPDIHLPERWPDRQPDPGSLAPSKIAREELRKILHLAQRLPNNRYNKLTVTDQQKIYNHLLDIHQSRAANWKVNYHKSSSYVPVPLGGGAVEIKNYEDAYFTPKQFLAEKAMVDRELMIRSCWFYMAVNGDNESFEGDGDASPAVDLINFLSAIETLQKQNDVGKSKVEVYQVGDFYELWMNHEFLYRHFPVSNAKASSQSKLGLARKSGQFSDRLQYRMDKKWKIGTSARSPLKRYPFHEWPNQELIRRHMPAENMKEWWKGVRDDTTATFCQAPTTEAEQEIWEEITRLQELLRERVQNIRDFVLPLPPTKKYDKISDASGSSEACGQLMRREPNLFDEKGRYAYTNALKKTEWKWNLMILDKFKAVGCDKQHRVYGNHDGYRGNPLLNEKLLKEDQAMPWISKHGIWFEHSHRWDNFNRDGMAFGAGVTNFVYYYNKRMLMANRLLGYLRIPWFLEPQEQESFIPGAAQWFLWVNFGHTFRGKRLKNWFTSKYGKVRPFGIYVNGHTHSADLIRMKFTPTNDAASQLSEEERQKEFDKLKRDAEYYLGTPEGLYRLFRGY